MLVTCPSALVHFEVYQLLMTHVPATCELFLITVFPEAWRDGCHLPFHSELMLLYTPQEALGSLQGLVLEEISFE